ncbi:MAG: lipopolysaccharide biosynthesis protein [Gammaproteobacteria bacterium]|nr:lipopolysaccharide biosynthesis protein [Gammaproteobacteria bacterium]
MIETTENSAHARADEVREKLRGYWRRRGTFLLVAGVSAALAIIVVMLLPSKYRSAATILIEQQEIPQDLVRSVITSYADQRIQMISQRVMTSENLMSLIERYDLYPQMRKKDSRDIVVQQMRADVGLHMISADVIDPRSGRPTQATIAFSVSYESRSPDLALKVANELTTLYLNENLTSRIRLARQTASFFKDEVARQAAQVDALDKSLAAYKEQHQKELPDIALMNIESLQRNELDLHDTENKIAALDSQRVLLEAQLAQINPNASVFTDTGQRVMGPADRLKALESQLAIDQARYAPDYPDVIAEKREIAGLKSQVGGVDDTAGRLRQLTAAKGQLAADLKRYSADYPDVVRLRKEVESLEADVAAASSGAADKTAAAHADNPAYIQVKGEIDALDVDRARAVAKRDGLKARVADYENRIGQAPAVQRGYEEIARKLQNAQLAYQQILEKQTDARISENLETERKGERFTLIDPPQPPERPVSPNRKLLLLVGLLLSAALGVGAVALQDRLDESVRGPGDIRRLLQVPALASIPVITTAEELLRRRRRRVYSWAGGGSALLLAVLYVHLFVRPLDVLWMQLARRFGA